MSSSSAKGGRTDSSLENLELIWKKRELRQSEASEPSVAGGSSSFFLHFGDCALERRFGDWLHVRSRFWTVRAWVIVSLVWVLLIMVLIVATPGWSQHTTLVDQRRSPLIVSMVFSALCWLVVLVRVASVPLREPLLVAFQSVHWVCVLVALRRTGLREIAPWWYGGLSYCVYALTACCLIGQMRFRYTWLGLAVVPLGAALVTSFVGESGFWEERDVGEILQWGLLLVPTALQRTVEAHLRATFLLVARAQDEAKQLAVETSTLIVAARAVLPPSLTVLVEGEGPLGVGRPLAFDGAVVVVVEVPGVCTALSTVPTAASAGFAVVAGDKHGGGRRGESGRRGSVTAAGGSRVPPGSVFQALNAAFHAIDELAAQCGVERATVRGDTFTGVVFPGTSSRTERALVALRFASAALRLPLAGAAASSAAAAPPPPLYAVPREESPSSALATLPTMQAFSHVQQHRQHLLGPVCVVAHMGLLRAWLAGSGPATLQLSGSAMENSVFSRKTGSSAQPGLVLASNALLLAAGIRARCTVVGTSFDGLLLSDVVILNPPGESPRRRPPSSDACVSNVATEAASSVAHTMMHRSGATSPLNPQSMATNASALVGSASATSENGPIASLLSLVGRPFQMTCQSPPAAGAASGSARAATGATVSTAETPVIEFVHSLASPTNVLPGAVLAPPSVEQASKRGDEPQATTGAPSGARHPSERLSPPDGVSRDRGESQTNSVGSLRVAGRVASDDGPQGEQSEDEMIAVEDSRRPPPLLARQAAPLRQQRLLSTASSTTSPKGSDGYNLPGGTDKNAELLRERAQVRFSLVTLRFHYGFLQAKFDAFIGRSRLTQRLHAIVAASMVVVVLSHIASGCFQSLADRLLMALIVVGLCAHLAVFRARGVAWPPFCRYYAPAVYLAIDEVALCIGLRCPSSSWGAGSAELHSMYRISIVLAIAIAGVPGEDWLLVVFRFVAFGILSISSGALRSVLLPTAPTAWRPSSPLIYVALFSSLLLFACSYAYQFRLRTTFVATLDARTELRRARTQSRAARDDACELMLPLYAVEWLQTHAPSSPSASPLDPASPMSASVLVPQETCSLASTTFGGTASNAGSGTRDSAFGVAVAAATAAAVTARRLGHSSPFGGSMASATASLTEPVGRPFFVPGADSRGGRSGAPATATMHTPNDAMLIAVLSPLRSDFPRTTWSCPSMFVFWIDFDAARTDDVAGVSGLMMEVTEALATLQVRRVRSAGAVAVFCAGLAHGTTLRDSTSIAAAAVSGPLAVLVASRRRGCGDGGAASHLGLPVPVVASGGVIDLEGGGHDNDNDNSSSLPLQAIAAGQRYVESSVRVVVTFGECAVGILGLGYAWLDVIGPPVDAAAAMVECMPANTMVATHEAFAGMKETWSGDSQAFSALWTDRVVDGLSAATFGWRD